MFVNNNGNVSFDSAISEFTPFGLTTTTSQPIIAPFFADVDTRSAGSPVTFGTGTVAGHNAFAVNYVNVDYFSSSATHTKFNSFQVVLIDRSDVAAGDFDIEFNYDSIQWETGDASGGTDGLGGTSAHAGFSNGSGNAGTYYELNGSGVPGSFLDSGPAGTSLIQNQLSTSDMVNGPALGRYYFDVRNGAINIPPTPTVTGPSTGTIGTPVTFQGSFTDPDAGETYSYTWHVTTDNPQVTPPADQTGTLSTPGSVPDFSFTPTGNANYSVTLTVTDFPTNGTLSESGSYTAVMTVGSPPVVTGDFNITGQEGQASTVQTVATFEDPTERSPPARTPRRSTGVTAPLWRHGDHYLRDRRSQPYVCRRRDVRDCHHGHRFEREQFAGDKPCHGGRRAVDRQQHGHSRRRRDGDRFERTLRSDLHRRQSGRQHRGLHGGGDLGR